MQDDKRACILFSIQVEAFMRYRSLQTKEYKKISKMYCDTAELCRFVRLYFTVLRSKGVSPSLRLKVLGFLLVKLDSMMTIGKFFPWRGEYILGVPRETMQVHHHFIALLMDKWKMKIMFSRKEKFKCFN